MDGSAVASLGSGPRPFDTTISNLGQAHFSLYILTTITVHTVKEKPSFCVEFFSVQFMAAGKEAFGGDVSTQSSPNLDLKELIMSYDLARALRDHTVQSISGNIYSAISIPKLQEERSPNHERCQNKNRQKQNPEHTYPYVKVQKLGFCVQAEGWTTKPETWF
jgi:hypothetical protein